MPGPPDFINTLVEKKKNFNGEQFLFNLPS
jgi:hypothetical protein